MKPVQYRQGDILLERVAALPPSVHLEEGEGSCILAYGEATGHAHKVTTHGRIWIDPDQPWRRYLEGTAETVLEHDEHAPIPLLPAVYEVLLQQEYDPSRPQPRRRVSD